jgi:hypothetical protein
MEQVLKITEKAGKNGKTYKNINLKDLEIGNSAVIEKVFAEGIKVNGKFGEVYSIAVRYKDDVVSAFLSPKDYNVFNTLGAIGDKIQVSTEEARATNPKTKVTMLYKKLVFTKI